MARLDDRFRDTVLGHLERTGLPGRRLGAEALNDPGFVASLKKGRRVGLATADAVLAAMGMAPVGPAFRREVEAFLTLTRTKAYVLGEASAHDAGFVKRLREGASFRLATVDKVRGWMASHADGAALRAMRRAVAGVALLDTAAPEPPEGGPRGRGRRQPTDEGETGMSHDDDNQYLSTRKAAAFLGLSPRTMDRNRMGGEGPSYYRFGHRILYRRADLEDWAEARRVALGAEADAARRAGPNGAEDGRRAP